MAKTRQPKLRCGNCGGPEVRVATTYHVWVTVLGVRLCARCYVRFNAIGAAREQAALQQDLNTLYAETHRGKAHA